MRIITPENSAFSPSGPTSDTQVVATLDEIIPVTANIVGVLATFWTSSSSSQLAARYLISAYAEIYSTTLNAGCQLDLFTIAYTEYGAPQTTGVGPMQLDAQTFLSLSNSFQIDNGTAVQWKVDVSGWLSDAGTLRVKASLLRLV